MAAKDSILTVRFEALGRETASVTDWSISSGYTVSTDGFSFTIYDTNRENLRRLELQPVELLLDGKSQLLGRIDKTEIGGGNGSALSCSGRDYLADVVECNVDPLVKLKDGDTLGTAMLTTLSTIGIDTVLDDTEASMRNVRSGVPIRSRNKKRYKAVPIKQLQPRPGEGQYEYCNRLLARFGGTLQPGPTRNSIVIGSPNYAQDPIATLRRSADAAHANRNNIDTATAVRDYSSFPTFTLFSGWSATGDDKGAGTNKTWDTYALAANFLGGDNELPRTLADSAISGRIKPDSGAEVGLGQLYRLLYFKDEQARSQEQIESSALRAIAERLKDTLVYTATVRGHIDEASGAIWSIDTIVQVEDEICGVSEPLWVADRTLSYSAGQGAMTQLTMYRPGSFQFAAGDND